MLYEAQSPRFSTAFSNSDSMNLNNRQKVHPVNSYHTCVCECNVREDFKGSIVLILTLKHCVDVMLDFYTCNILQHFYLVHNPEENSSSHTEVTEVRSARRDSLCDLFGPRSGFSSAAQASQKSCFRFMCRNKEYVAKLQTVLSSLFNMFRGRKNKRWGEGGQPGGV